MTLSQLIDQLQLIAEDSSRLDQEVYIYPFIEIELETPNPILSIDTTISDRIDINA